MSKRGMKQMSNTLRKLRGKTGMNQTEFSKLCGISTPQYRRYETGVSYPREETLAKIASVLGVEVEEITGEKPASSEPTLTELLMQVSPEVIKNLKNEHTELNEHEKAAGKRVEEAIDAILKSFNAMTPGTSFIEKESAINKSLNLMSAQFDSFDSIGKATRLALANSRSIQLAALIECYDDLTPEGQQVLLSVADALTYSPKYKKPEEETQEKPEENTDNQKETPGE